MAVHTQVETTSTSSDRRQPDLVVPTAVSVEDAARRSLFLSLHLPEWIFPTFSSADRASWSNDPIVGGFVEGWSAWSDVVSGSDSGSSAPCTSGTASANTRRTRWFSRATDTTL